MQFDEIRELGRQAHAFQAAAEAATIFAVRHGAADEMIAEVLRDLHAQLADTGPRDRTDRVQRARHALRCRRESCLAMAALALDCGADDSELTNAIAEMMAASALLADVRTPADLGFGS